MNNENNGPAAAPDALQAFISCPEWGTGGQFVYDPVTKTRTRVGAAPAAVGVPASVPEQLSQVPGETTAAAEVSTDPAAPAGVAEVAAVEAAEAATPPKKERTRA